MFLLTGVLVQEKMLREKLNTATTARSGHDDKTGTEQQNVQRSTHAIKYWLFEAHATPRNQNYGCESKCGLKGWDFGEVNRISAWWDNSLTLGKGNYIPAFDCHEFECINLSATA